MQGPEKLRDWLDTAEKTQPEFAAEIGVHQATISKWCNRKTTPRGAQMRALFKATGGYIRPDDFLLGPAQVETAST